jgi:hypothetical protein
MLMATLVGVFFIPLFFAVIRRTSESGLRTRQAAPGPAVLEDLHASH